VQVRVKSVGMGRVWVCMLLCYSQIHYRDMVTPKGVTRPVGVEVHKKPKDLSASDIEERGYGKGVGVHATLLQSDTVQQYGRAKTDNYHQCPFILGSRAKKKYSRQVGCHLRHS
jgi:hypothetical protein